MELSGRVQPSRQTAPDSTLTVASTHHRVQSSTIYYAKLGTEGEALVNRNTDEVPGLGSCTKHCGRYPVQMNRFVQPGYIVITKDILRSEISQ